MSSIRMTRLRRKADTTNRCLACFLKGSCPDGPRFSAHGSASSMRRPRADGSSTHPRSTSAEQLCCHRTARAIHQDVKGHRCAQTRSRQLAWPVQRLRQRKPAAHALKKTTDRHRCRLWIKVLIPGSFSHPCLQGLDQKRLLTRQICLQDSGQGRVTPGTEGKFCQHQEEGWFCLHLAGKPLQIRSKLLAR